MLITDPWSRESFDQLTATKLHLQKHIENNTERDLRTCNVTMIHTLKTNLQSVKYNIY